MWFIILLFTSFVLSIFLWKYGFRKSFEHPLPPIYPGALPIIGHTRLLMGNFNTDIMELKEKGSSYCTEHGGVMTTFLGSSIYYFITDPEDALTVSNACPKKNFMIDVLKAWMGQGLITRDGETWKSHRKLMNPAFNLQIVNNFLGLFNSQYKKLVENLKQYAGNGPINIIPELGRILMETSCMSTYGTKLSAHEMETISKSIKDLSHLLVQKILRIWLQIDFLYKILGHKHKEQKLVKYLHEVTDKVIKNVKESKEDPLKSSSDVTKQGFRCFIDIFQDIPGISALTEEEFRNEVDTTIGASFDTSWSSAVYILLCIGSHAEVQAKIYQEIMNVIGKDRDVEKEDLPKLVYTEAVIKESLRWMTPVPLVIRYIDQEVKLKNYTLRAGTNCGLILHGINRHGLADGELFKPERWLDLSSPHTHKLASFSFGKRSCIGKTYGISSMKVAVVHLVRNYVLSADISKTINEIGFTMMPIKGHEISLEKRV